MAREMALLMLLGASLHETPGKNRWPSGKMEIVAPFGRGGSAGASGQLPDPREPNLTSNDTPAWDHL